MANFVKTLDVELLAWTFPPFGPAAPIVGPAYDVSSALQAVVTIQAGRTSAGLSANAAALIVEAAPVGGGSWYPLFRFVPGAGGPQFSGQVSAVRSGTRLAVTETVAGSLANLVPGELCTFYSGVNPNVTAVQGCVIDSGTQANPDSPGDNEFYIDLAEPGLWSVVGSFVTSQAVVVAKKLDLTSVGQIRVSVATRQRAVFHATASVCSGFQ